MKLTCTALLSLLTLTLAFGQSTTFVNPDNVWYARDVCFSNGNWLVDVYEYRFTLEPVVIDNIIYQELQTDNPDPDLLARAGQFYRQEAGKVFMKEDTETAEYLIYDFNPQLGDTLTIGRENRLLVTAIDSLRLLNGEMRKRLRIARPDRPEIYGHWIEGIGSEFSPLNPLGMFSLDCWNDLACFWELGETQYSPQRCELGNFDVVSTAELTVRGEDYQLYPNPAGDFLQLQLPAGIVLGPATPLTITDMQGKVYQNWERQDTKVWVGQLPPGVYILKLPTPHLDQIIVRQFIKM